MTEWEYAKRCAVCGAGVGEWCRPASGGGTVPLHTARVVASSRGGDLIDEDRESLDIDENSDLDEEDYS